MSITETGQFLMQSIGLLQNFIRLCIGFTIGVIVFLLLLRYLPELMRLNPYSQTYRALRRPTNELISHLRRSRLYGPLKQSLNFDPAPLMALVSLAILWYITTGILQNFFIALQGIGLGLISAGRGEIFAAISYLLGAGILGVLFFLMALMTIVFVNSIFGLFGRQTWWAQQRLDPLLKLFEFGGPFTGWSFVILWIALSFAATAVQAIFF
ncbi:MAG: hypothetical protein EBU88_06930 [Acidobacteria bacterium]|nr:hypothetical protein [Acidobacteriota bacterium]